MPTRSPEGRTQQVGGSEVSALFTIKPLEWEAPPHSEYFFEAKILGLKYTVYQSITEKYWCVFDNSIKACASIEDGKRLCEEDWQKRLSAALVPVPSEDPSERTWKACKRCMWPGGTFKDSTEAERAHRAYLALQTDRCEYQSIP